jgi:hypothetical protein
MDSEPLYIRLGLSLLYTNLGVSLCPDLVPTPLSCHLYAKILTYYKTPKE